MSLNYRFVYIRPHWYVSRCLPPGVFQKRCAPAAFSREAARWPRHLLSGPVENAEAPPNRSSAFLSRLGSMAGSTLDYHGAPSRLFYILMASMRGVCKGLDMKLCLRNRRPEQYASVGKGLAIR